MLHNINLLPWREQQQIAHRKRFINLLVLGVFAAGGLLLATGWYVEKQNQAQQSRLDFLNQHIQHLDAKINSLKTAEQEHRDIMKRLTVVESLQQQRNKITQFMDLTPALIPEGVYVDRISMTGKRIELTGISDSTARLATMLDLLENVPYLSEVDIHSIVSGSQRYGKQFQSFNVSFLFEMHAEPLELAQEAMDE